MQKTVSEIRTVGVSRYITPLREGGSLPGLVQADDDFLYVVKFRGAGQGRKALIAELVGGEIARFLGLKVPEIVYATLDEAFGRMEGDEEIQDLLKASEGLNLAVHYLSGAITFDPVAVKVSGSLASAIVWLDALLMNVDRTSRNTNMLSWQRELWLIDHGASLYFHHSWSDNSFEPKPFPMIANHVLLPFADALEAIDGQFRQLLTPEVVASTVALIPDEWLLEEPYFGGPEEHRGGYIRFLNQRISKSFQFVKEAQYARKTLV